MICYAAYLYILRQVHYGIYKWVKINDFQYFLCDSCGYKMMPLKTFFVCLISRSSVKYGCPWN